MGWSGLWDELGSIGKAVLGTIARVAAVVIEEAKKLVDHVATELSKAFRAEPKTDQERIERELQDVNERIQYLRKKYKERGGLSDKEKRQWHELRAERDELNSQLSSLERYQTAAEISEKEKDYSAIHITDETAHILQYHVGQNAFNKICECRRPMVLQWNRNIETPGLKDLVWGCSGWYIEAKGRRACEKMVRLTMDDLDLFANLKRPEFSISSEQLTKIALDPVKAKRLRAALHGIKENHRSRRMGVAVYRCPVHGESLLLRKKKDPKGFLDEFLLGCPRWLPDNAGCNFIVKLKSAAQVSGLLDAETGSGLIKTAG